VRADHTGVVWHYCDCGHWKDILVVFGGSCGTGLLNDLWTYDVDTSTCAQHTDTLFSVSAACHWNSHTFPACVSAPEFEVIKLDASMSSAMRNELLPSATATTVIMFTVERIDVSMPDSLQVAAGALRRPGTVRTQLPCGRHYRRRPAGVRCGCGRECNEPRWLSCACSLIHLLCLFLQKHSWRHSVSLALSAVVWRMLEKELEWCVTAPTLRPQAGRARGACSAICTCWI